jgi:hypothetical protein
LIFSTQEGQDGLDEELHKEKEEQILVDTPQVNCDLGRDIHLVDFGFQFNFREKRTELFGQFDRKGKRKRIEHVRNDEVASISSRYFL